MADVAAPSIAANVIITPDMVPPPAEPLEAQAAQYKTLADQVSDLAQQLRAANAMREDAAQSPGWDVGHEKNRQLAADYGCMAGIYTAAAQYFTGVAGVYRDAQRAQRSVVNRANQELSQAKNAVQQQAIVARWHAHARALTTSAVGAATARATVFQETAGTDITALTSRLGGTPMPRDPVLPHSGGSGIAVPPGKEKPLGLGDDPEPQDADPTGISNSNDASDAGVTHGHRPAGPREHVAGTEGTATGSPMPTPALGTPFPPGATQLPAGGGSGVRSVGFPPGLSSPGGLGGLPASTGQLPGTQAAGLGGLPVSAPAAGGQAAQAAQLGPAFSRGVSAGAGLGSLPPSTGIGTPAAAQTGSAPAAGLASGDVAPTGVAAAGATPVTVTPAGAGVATGSGTAHAPAMMLPPPGLGAPAAPAAAGGAAAVTPAGSSATPSGSAGPAGPTGGSPAGSGAAMVVPASVVSAGTTNRSRAESPELAAAKELVRRLRRDSDMVNYACIEWAVGVFRSEANGTTECVAMSNEGFGYIPWSVFLPRTARLLAADKLADDQFRQRWFGAADPAEVMDEYARLRASRGAHLVAMAVTADSPFGPPPGVEHAVCGRELAGDGYVRPTLDDMGMHRLEATHPDLFARIQRLTGTEDQARLVENQVVLPLAMQMIDAVQTTSVQTPPELRQMWNELGTGDSIGSDAWQKYKIAATVFFVNVSANRPAPDGEVAVREQYRGQWVAARAMELLQGWERRPIATADMVYAAATAYPGDFAAKLEPLLRGPEDGG